VLVSADMRLPDDELRRRARRLRLVVTDNDGVLTDNGVYVSDSGELLKRYSFRDGMGVHRLREHGIDTCIVTAEESAIAVRRGEKLRLRHVFVGVKDKRARLPDVLAASGCELGELAYIGDDVNDLGILRAVAAQGLTGAPLDAMPQVRAAVHHVGTVAAGHGAFRDFAEWLLALRGSAGDRNE
jgi:3-deoxy-D-manno-octulosonate 8-phosphate phosphatase (KDO 8-P phosphatase)